MELFDLLKRLNQGDVTYYRQLSDDEKRGVSLYLLALWGIHIDQYQPYHILLLQEQVNKYLFSHPPELIWALLVASLTEDNATYTWRKKRTKKAGETARIRVLATYFDVSEREAKSWLSLYQTKDIKAMARDLGWDEKEIRKIK